jgi:hypothetical protein
VARAWVEPISGRTRRYGQYAYLIHMLRMRKKPPAGMADLNSGQVWSEADLADPKRCLRRRDSIKAIAEFLCREPGEVRAKIAEIARDRS